MEVIILAGGFGKRLQDRVNNLPKPMAPINGRPFLDYLFDYLFKNNIEKVILSVFYKFEQIKEYYKNSYKNISISYSIDSEPLGTGGAIKAALKKSSSENTLIINGDTYFNVDLECLYKYHSSKKNDITIALKKMENFDRYGTVETNKEGKVLTLKKRVYRKSGSIDGGIYLVKNDLFYENDDKYFSFNDFIINNINKLKIGSLLFDEVFIDIGVPNDYDKANKVLIDKL